MATPTENEVKDVNQDAKSETEINKEAAQEDIKTEDVKKSKEDTVIDDKNKDIDNEDEQAPSLEAIQKDLDAQKALLQESDDRYKRLQADFANFRRRNEKERVELSAVILQGLIKELLPVVDNFERALAVEKAQGDALYEGISMVYKQLMASLEKNGLESIKAVGEKFDPNLHQAVMRVQDADKEDDTIEEELQKGYMVQGRVIRPSMVKVVAN